MFTRRPLALALLLTTSFVASACTAILVPDQSDDGVTRCNNTDECEQPDDNRWRSLCVFGEDQDNSSDKVCTPDFAEVECNPGESPFAGDHPMAVLYEEALDSKGLYISCDEENLGKRGCPPPNAGACNDGLVANGSNICDDTDDSTPPAIMASSVGGPDIAGQDVVDQYCRSYFCDESYVCDTTGTKWLCKPCSSDAIDDFGGGGCGTLHIQGEPSPAYVTDASGAADLSNANCSGELGDLAQSLGTAPTAG